jgi:hypothetical protein
MDMMMLQLLIHHLLVEEILAVEGLENREVLGEVLVQVVLERKKHFNYG